MQLANIDLGKLSVSKLNMRNGKAPPDVSDILAEHRGGPLRRRPDAQDHHAEADEDLADEKSGRSHGVSPPPADARAGGEASLVSCGSDR